MWDTVRGKGYWAFGASPLRWRGALTRLRDLDSQIVYLSSRNPWEDQEHGAWVLESDATHLLIMRYASRLLATGDARFPSALGPEAFPAPSVGSSAGSGAATAFISSSSAPADRGVLRQPSGSHSRWEATGRRPAAAAETEEDRSCAARRTRGGFGLARKQLYADLDSVSCAQLVARAALASLLPCTTLKPMPHHRPVVRSAAMYQGDRAIGGRRHLGAAPHFQSPVVVDFSPENQNECRPVPVLVGDILHNVIGLALKE